MLGSLLAGCDECPGETEEIEGKTYKTYRGMGSMEAMQKGMGRDRYGQQNTQKTVAEGVVGRVIYRGKLAEVLFQLVGGLRQGMGYAGAATIADLHAKTRFVRITNAGLLESHPHSITGIREAPNYKRN
jgi:IMP dehydrogenase